MERQKTIEIFRNDDVTVSVVEYLRIDTAASASGGFVSARLEPLSVVIEKTGEATRVVDLDAKPVAQSLR